MKIVEHLYKLSQNKSQKELLSAQAGKIGDRFLWTLENTKLYYEHSKME
jgi:hypothetical protein